MNCIFPCRVLIKRAQGRSRLGFKNFKKRFFVLTNKGLSYSKDKTKATLGHIPVCDILGTERLGEESFHVKLVRDVDYKPTINFFTDVNFFTVNLSYCCLARCKNELGRNI